MSLQRLWLELEYLSPRLEHIWWVEFSGESWLRCRKSDNGTNQWSIRNDYFNIGSWKGNRKRLTVVNVFVKKQTFVFNIYLTIFIHIRKGGWSSVWLNPQERRKKLPIYKKKRLKRVCRVQILNITLTEWWYVFIFLRTDGEWVGGWRQKNSRDFNMVLFPSHQVIQYENEYIKPFS